jgi:tetratricopeptide (TPR) repeat protein
MSAAGDAATKGYQDRREGKLSSALEHYADAARLYREQGDSLAYAHTIRHIADICQQDHKLTAAKPLYEEALEIYRSHLDTKLLDLANTVRPYALLLEEEGNSSLALTLWEEARNLYNSLRIQPGVSECDDHIAHLRLY